MKKIRKGTSMFCMAAGALMCAAQFSAAAPVINRLTPPSKLFSANIPDPPITARFLPGQRFDLQATITPDAGMSIQEAGFWVDGVQVSDTVSVAPATALKTPGSVVVSFRAYANMTPGVHILEIVAKQSDEQVVTARGNFEVVPIQETGLGAKNIIILIGDGMGIAQRTAARIIHGGITQGKVANRLAMDRLPYTGLVSVHSLNSIVTDSSAGAAPYATGNKANNNQHGVFPDDTVDKFDNPRIESIGEYLHRLQGRSLGIVTTADIEDSTPGGFGSHTQDRNAGTGICDQYLDERESTGLTVLMGGGRRWFLPSTTYGSERNAAQDYVLPADSAAKWGVSAGQVDAERDLIGEFQNAGWTYVADNTQLQAIQPQTTRLLGLFSFANMSVAKDKIDKRRNAALPPGGVAVVDVLGFPDQPMLDEMADKALKVLAQNSNGFVAMIEGAAIDKQLHLMDSERFMLDTIEFDRAIEVCLRFAAQNEKDTLVIVTADHECGGAHVIGSSKLTHADLAGRLLNGSSGISGFRNGVVGTLESAGFPKYQMAQDGYPINIDIDYRPLVGYACNADRCEDWLTNPYPIANSSHSTVNTKWYTISPPFPISPTQRDPNGFLVTGQIADAIATHTATDVVVSAYGRGASKFRGQIDNTDVFFKVMEAALGDLNPGHDKLKE